MGIKLCFQSCHLTLDVGAGESGSHRPADVHAVDKHSLVHLFFLLSLLLDGRLQQVVCFVRFGNLTFVYAHICGLSAEFT